MSMTQIAFLKKADLPTNKQIQDTLQALGYDFKFLSSLDKTIDEDGLECSIEGHETFFETHVDGASNALDEYEADWIKPDLTNQDLAISFRWGADAAAGACIGLISIALIDKCGALSYYMDDEMKYTREMLVADTPQFLAALNEEKSVLKRESNVNKPASSPKESFWSKLKSKFK